MLNKNYTNIDSTAIISAFQLYEDAILAIDIDLKFWKSFLNWAVNEYPKFNPTRNPIYEGGFHVYDIPHDSPFGKLKIDRASYSIHPDDLEKHPKSFFSWIMNYSIVKAYNTMELFLLQSIQLAYFPTLKDPLKGNKHAYKLNEEIKNCLTSYDQKNNRHIVQFLKNKSTKFTSFSNQTIRTDINTNWEIFFELISILRNIVAHHGMIVTTEVLNEIKSKAKDVFERTFEHEEVDGNIFLNPKDEQNFSNFLNLINDFTLNTVKFVFDENDLSFLGLTS